jgi:predicted Zn-dependent protease
VSALLLLALACATSPTGRSQLLLMSEAEMAQMGKTAFADIQAETPRSKNARDEAYVRCVAKAITDVLTPEELRPVAVTSWEVELFEDPTANAFALPGGKIGVHTGLLAVARTRGQLAAVLGHEVGHVIARHGNERVSQTSLVQSGLSAVQVMLGADSTGKQTLIGALGLGAQYGILMPFGRDQESEADEIGVDLMARAGFDPNESVKLWQNMQQASQGQSPPEFMSTHPSHQTRISHLESLVPSAMETQQQALISGRQPTCNRSGGPGEADEGR